MTRFDKKEIGSILRALRIYAGLKQHQIADRLGCQRSTYTCYEVGKTCPSIKTLDAIAAIYNISLADLFLTNKENVSEMPIYCLTQDEKQLLRAYRSCSPEDQKAIIACANEQKEADSANTGWLQWNKFRK